jgi:hypothetical protein
VVKSRHLYEAPVGNKPPPFWILLAAWVLTLPVSILLLGSLFWVFSHFGT